MSYKKPICDCGEELVIRQEVVYEDETKITANGEKYKKSKTMFVIDYLNWERLHCIKCGKEYEYELDEKQRIIRGNIRE